jgi:hypothetical protein
MLSPERRRTRRVLTVPSGALAALAVVVAVEYPTTISSGA